MYTLLAKKVFKGIKRLSFKFIDLLLIGFFLANNVELLSIINMYMVDALSDAKVIPPISNYLLKTLVENGLQQLLANVFANELKLQMNRNVHMLLYAR